jgi:hypothetical protein
VVTTLVITIEFAVTAEEGVGFAEERLARPALAIQRAQMTGHARGEA